MSPVRLDVDQGVATVTLARAQVHNAFDDTLIAALTRTFEDLQARGDVQVVVLTGDGSSFSAGADLNWMRRMAAAGEDENRADALLLATLMRRLRELPKPTIARVNGHAFGGGVGLVACCDMAIAVDDAKFGLTEVRLGLVPAAISPHVIDAIGGRQASRWFLTGERFDAQTALRIGLIHEVVSAERLDDAVQAQVRQLAGAGPIAVAEAKSLIRRLTAAADAAAIDADNAALIARLRVSAEGQEGLTAFLDKRPPRWPS